MTSYEAHARYTPAEYLEIERADEWKNEYLNGQIIPMPRESMVHVAITGNIGCELSAQVRHQPTEVLMSRMRVKVSETGLYTYPDVVVACPPIDLEDDHLDTLLNPVVIVEVLSPSTEAYDRGAKFAHYRRVESLQEYLLVAEDRLWIEHYARHGEQWVLTEYTTPDDRVSLNAIGCAIELRRIYGKVGLRSGSRQPAPTDAPSAMSERRSGAEQLAGAEIAPAEQSGPTT